MADILVFDSDDLPKTSVIPVIPDLIIVTASGPTGPPADMNLVTVLAVAL